MSFEKLIRIPTDRIGVLIGKSGKTKSQIENSCSVKLEIDSETGETLISGTGNVEDIQPFKAMEIVTAIGRGFSPRNAMKLLEGENTLHVIDLREFAGKSPNQVERIKGRIIGEDGKARKNMERLSDTYISVYGRTVAIIGATSKLKLVVDAISSISNGSMHGSVYNKLESARKRDKLERLKLWEDQNVF
ncbi:MAG TPA: KH domain-containing protein [Nitrosopumilaceae archaeon]|nr:KH domain-containing protein [Nitrosopumilaceae archaeon]